MENKIKRINRTLKYQGAIVDFYSDTMQMPDGRTAQWDLIHHRKGAAAVVPVLPDGRIVMVRQFRNALDRITLEIPAGARDNTTEETIRCAARELEEETGYHSEQLDFLISLRTTVAYCDEFIDVYLATDLKPGKQHLDEDEFLNVEAHDLAELKQMIFDCKIQDSKTICGILTYAAKLEEK